MSEYTEYPAAPEPDEPGQASASKPKRWPWVAGIVAALFVGVAIGQTDTGTDDGTAIAEPAATVTVTAEPGSGDQADEPDPAPSPEPEPEPKYDEPTAESFTLTVQTLEKQCFGSAGCNVTFRVQVEASNPAIRLDPAATYELTYEIPEAESAYINTLTIDGDEYETDSEEFTSTASDVDLTAVVTSISER